MTDLNTDNIVSISKLKTIQRVQDVNLWGNGNTETLLKAWGEKAGGWRWMHLNSARYWRHKNNCLSICGIVLSSIVSISSLGSYFEVFVSIQFVMGFVGIIGIINVLVQTIQSYYKPEEKALLHESTAKQFAFFYRKIENMLNMSRVHRDPPDRFSSWALMEYERIQQDAPSILEESIQKFQHVFKKQFESGNVPDLANHYFNITVYEF